MTRTEDDIDNSDFGFGALNNLDSGAPFRAGENDERLYKPKNLNSRICEILDQAERDNAPVSPKRPLSSLKRGFERGFSLRTSGKRQSIEQNSHLTSVEAYRTSIGGGKNFEIAKNYGLPKTQEEIDAERKKKFLFAGLFFFGAFIVTLSVALSTKSSSSNISSEATESNSVFPLLKQDEFIINEISSAGIGASGSRYEIFGKVEGSQFQLTDEFGTPIKFLIGCEKVPLTCLTAVFESGNSKTVGDCSECANPTFLAFDENNIYDLQVLLVDEVLDGLMLGCPYTVNSETEFGVGGLVNGTNSEIGAGDLLELNLDLTSAEKMLMGFYGYFNGLAGIQGIGFIFKNLD
eukprot:snap_masked-scaffold_8-processed-gene-10.32-mRNA-1 protein AED:1.00 eAED:1.00 QI:0/-1/0/0/-1/1/1/0/348